MSRHADRADQAADPSRRERQIEELIGQSLGSVSVTPEEYAMAGREPPHNVSPTEIAAEVLRTGLFPGREPGEIPGEDALLRSGDPDVDPLENEFSGEEVPGGSNPTPDQNDVDDIGRAYGVSEQGTGPLRSVEEILERRDAHRWEAESKEPL